MQVNHTHEINTLEHKGNTEAQFKLGEHYKKGNYIKIDYDEAIKLYRKDAYKGCLSAQWKLGLCYFYGHGIKKNKSRALKWFIKAAAQDHPDALTMLGEYYEEGVYVPKNIVFAEHYYKRGAEKGDEFAKSWIMKNQRKSKNKKIRNRQKNA